MTISRLPPDLQDKLRRAERLAWITIVVMIGIIVMMGLVMGSSQAMRTAWIEDILSLVPPIVFLIATRLERWNPTSLYPFGFERAHSIAFLVAAVALASMGGLLAFDAVVTLVRQERPSIGSVNLFGREIWLGWLMIAALVVSTIPPVILGHLKHELAEPLRDKILHTDALMNKADWMTGLAGVAGILGIAFGYWWADSAAALIISVDILFDGARAARIATAELADSVPRELNSPKIAEDALRIAREVRAVPGVRGVRMRETGRLIDVVVETDRRLPPHENDIKNAIGKDNWRVAHIAIVIHGDATDEALDPARAKTGLYWTPWTGLLGKIR